MTDATAPSSHAPNDTDTPSGSDTPTRETGETVRTFLERGHRFAAELDAAGSRTDAATPCEDWTVRDVAEHVVSTQRDFLARQDLVDGPAPDMGDPAAGFRAHLDAVSAVLADPAVAARSFDGYFGPTTVGATLADFYGWDQVIHAWDVARAVGRPGPITEDEADDLARTADGWGPALYSEGICGPAVPVPDDAPAVDRLLARLGRDPHWTPPAS